MIARRAIIIFLVLSVLILGYAGFTNMKASTLTVVLDGDYPLTSTRVTIDDKQVFPSGQGAKNYRANVRTGDHAVEVTSPGYEIFTDKVSLGFMSKETLTVTLKEISPASVANELMGNTPWSTVLNATYFGDKDWMVYFVGSSAGSNEGSLVVARFFANDKKWYIVYEGTDVDTSAGVFAEAPDDLINYLRNY